VGLGSSRHVHWVSCHAIALLTTFRFSLENGEVKEYPVRHPFNYPQNFPWEQPGKWVYEALSMCVCEALAMRDRTGLTSMRSPVFHLQNFPWEEMQKCNAWKSHTCSLEKIEHEVPLRSTHYARSHWINAHTYFPEKTRGMRSPVFYPQIFPWEDQVECAPNYADKFPLRTGRLRNIHWDRPFDHPQNFPWEKLGESDHTGLTPILTFLRRPGECDRSFNHLQIFPWERRG
jgi:hypothetical protein